MRRHAQYLLARYAPWLLKPIRYVRAQTKFALTKRKVRTLLNTNIKLELASGDRRDGNGWITLDLTPQAGLYWDLRNGIPFPNETVSALYCSHFLEHLTYRECQTFLNECLRVLKRGASLSICVPNSRLWIDAYVADVPTFERLDFLGYAPAFNRTTSIDWVNYVAYMDGQHKYLFDEQNLIHILREKGFSVVASRNFDSNLDRIERHNGSIYALATK